MNTNEQAKQIVLRNVRVKYAKLIKPGQAMDENQPDLWSVNMYVTDADHAILNDLGAVPKVDKSGVEYFVGKRNVKNKKGEDVKPPAIVDKKKQPFTEEIGNGSECNIAITPFHWTKLGKSGVLLYLNAVQVVNFVAQSSGVDAFSVIDTNEPNVTEDDGLPF